jgi:glycosyltransferase involved in cell wall biosynthesis
MKKLNILVSTPTFLPVIGGAELGIHEIYSRIGMNHNVTIVTPKVNSRSNDSPSNKDYTKRPYNVIEFVNPLSNVKPGLVKKLLEISSIPYIRGIYSSDLRRGYDVANFHFISPHGLAAVWLKKRYRVPVVLSLVGRSDVWSDYSFLQKVYARLSLMNASKVIPITNYCVEGYGSENNKFSVIPYGVDTRNFSPSKRQNSVRKEMGVRANDFLVFSVQRLAPIKRVDVLIRVMARVVKTNPDIVLAIGGQGEEYDNLKNLIEELGLSKNVRLIGYISEVKLPDYYAAADVFALHSISETFGIVFAQAMSSGLPIVSIKSTCIPEVVPNNVSGLLVKPFDIIAFSKAIINLKENKNLYKKISLHNRKRALTEFDWDVIAHRYESVLMKAVKE